MAELPANTRVVWKERIEYADEKGLEWSRLPYVEHKMDGEQDFDSLWIDEERLIGIKAKASHPSQR